MRESAADRFRKRQVLGDLHACLRYLGPDVVRRVADRMPPSGLDPGVRADVLARVVEDGARFYFPKDRDAFEGARLAAALPDEDFPAFVFATALLLSDRMQDGAGDDDLYWNWDAFRAQYATSDPAARAALMNAFRLGAETGQVRIADLPAEDECLTNSKDRVLSWLASEGLADLAEAIKMDVGPEEAGRLWEAASGRELSPAEVFGFRYLYERPQSMAPEHDAAPLIPWVPA